MTVRKIVAFSTVLLLTVVLSGCVNGNSFSLSNVSKSKVVDYSLLSCNEIWLLKDDNAFNSAVYWLQVMNCTKNLSATEVQAQLNVNLGARWSVLFKRSILLAHINNVDNEQRQILDKLVKQKDQLSVSVKEIVNLWVKNQQLQFAFNIEKSKYQRLRENSESQIKELSDELLNIQVKLKSLTEIERQLPTRKPTQNSKSDTTSTDNEVENNGQTDAVQSIEPISDNQLKQRTESAPVAIENKPES